MCGWGSGLELIGVDGSGWMDMDGYGRIWMDMEGYGWLCGRDGGGEENEALLNKIII
jgi:hypothetical protein